MTENLEDNCPPLLFFLCIYVEGEVTVVPAAFSKKDEKKYVLISIMKYIGMQWQVCLGETCLFCKIHVRGVGFEIQYKPA